MLMDHADAGGNGVARAVAGERHSGKTNPAGIRADHSEQRFHQRALAGAVLAEQADDAAGFDREIDGAVGPNRAVTLDDALHVQKRGHGVCLLADRAGGTVRCRRGRHPW